MRTFIPLYSLYMAVLFGYLIVFAIISLVFYFRTQNDFAKEQLVTMNSPLLVVAILKDVILCYIVLCFEVVKCRKSFLISNS